jgi:hypothetical protein
MKMRPRRYVTTSACKSPHLFSMFVEELVQLLCVISSACTYIQFVDIYAGISSEAGLLGLG